MSGHRAPYDLLQSPFIRYSTTNAETITIDRWGMVVAVTTAGAETRTLAQPTKAGLLATVAIDTYVGALTLTVAGGYNADSTLTITFNTAGDFVTFISIKIGSSYYWRVVAQEGTNAAAEDFSVDQLTATDFTLNSTTIDAYDSMAAGAGITAGTGTIVDFSVFQVGSLIKTEIFIDITGLNSGGADNDIIGVNGAAACHIGQITAAVNGTIVGGRMTCLEIPATGSLDIDLYCGDEGSGTASTEDEARTGLTNGAALVTAGGNWANGTVKGLTANPGANQYLYLTGNASNNTYTTGQFLIELLGR